MKQHTVLLTFNQDGKVVALSEDQTRVEPNVHVANGDQIRWTSPHGKVDIQFQSGTPFTIGAAAKDEDFRTISASGTLPQQFPYTCSIMINNQSLGGWQGKCGGIVIVGGSPRSGGG